MFAWYPPLYPVRACTWGFSSCSSKINRVQFVRWPFDCEYSSYCILADYVRLIVFSAATLPLQAMNYHLTWSSMQIMWNKIIVSSVGWWCFVVQKEILVMNIRIKLLIQHCSQSGDGYVLPSWKIAILKSLFCDSIPLVVLTAEWYVWSRYDRAQSLGHDSHVVDSHCWTWSLFFHMSEAVRRSRACLNR